MDRLGNRLQAFIDKVFIDESIPVLAKEVDEDSEPDKLSQLRGDLNLIDYCTKEISSKSCTNYKQCPYAPNKCDVTTKKCVYTASTANQNMRKCVRLFMSPELRPEFEIEIGENEVKPEDGFTREYCTDLEYDNIKGGLCTFLPKSRLFDCGAGLNTQTGICFSNEIQTECLPPKVWVPKADTYESCLKKGSYCEHKDGSLSLLRGLDCTSCGGLKRNRYVWTANPSSPQGLDNNVAVVPVLRESVRKLEARQLINRFQSRLFTLMRLFQAFACDCLERQTSCFNKRISVPVGDYIVDPKVNGEFKGLFLDSRHRQSRRIFNLTVKMFSATNFISNSSMALSETVMRRREDVGDEPKEHHLTKRCNPLSSYEVVYESRGGRIIGQIIGNGYEYTSSNSYSEVKLCLSVDKSIPIGKSYNIYDFGVVFDGNVYPQSISVTFDGKQVCGTVTAFSGITYIPIRRS